MTRLPFARSVADMYRFAAFALVLLTPFTARCQEEETEDNRGSSPAANRCPDGEHPRATIYDLDSDAIGERTAIAAVEVFLRQQGGDATIENFELIDGTKNQRTVRFVYRDAEFTLARLYVERLEQGWFVLSFENCKGAV